VLADGQHILDLKRKGDIFGEMSVISQKPCTASIITKEQTRVFSIKSQSIGAYSDLNSDELNNTLYRLFAMILTDKLSMTTHKAREYERTKNELLLEVIVRKQKEAALRENEERLALTLRGTNAGLWDWYIKSGKTVFNERWAEIIGYTLKELEPVSIDTWIKYTHPDDFKKSNELLKKHFSGELGFYECEVRMQHKNGEWVWVLDRGMISEWDQEGNPVRVTGTHIEITDRINKEEQIKASLLGKRKAEERAYLAQKMALFAQAFPFPILSIDNTGKIETANRAAALAFQKVVVGLNFSDLFPNLTDSFLDEIRQSGRVFFINISIRSRYYLFTFQMVKQFDVVHVFGTDISKLRQAEEKAHEKLLIEALYHRAGEILHEVGNKALILVGYLAEIRYIQQELRTADKNGDTGLIKKLIDTLSPEIGHALETLNVLQEIVDRMSQRKRKFIEKQKINIFRLVRNSIEDEKYKVPMVNFKLNCPKELKQMTYQADEIHLGQILSNLLKNAEHAIRSKEKQFITVDISVRKNCLTIDVIDNGTGIPKALQSKIFEDGYSTKGAEGKGIGLALCQSLALANDGTLELAWSNETEGSAFRLTLNSHNQNG